MTLLNELSKRVPPPYREQMQLVLRAKQADEEKMQESIRFTLTKLDIRVSADIAALLIKGGFTMGFVAASTQLKLHTISKIAKGEPVDLDEEELQFHRQLYNAFL